MVKKLKKHFHSLTVKAVAALTVLSSCAGAENKQLQTEDSNQPQTEVKTPAPNAPADLSTVPMNEALEKGWCEDMHSFVDKASHVTDTVILNKNNYKSRMCLGIYLQNEDLVHIKYFIPDTTNTDAKTAQTIIKTAQMRNDELFWKSNKAHEYKHRQTHKSGVFKRMVNAEDYARLNQHNEIASYTANLLYERETYKKACEMCIYNQEALLNLISPRFNAYREAIKKGYVDPFSTNPRMQEYENYIIAKTAFDWWVKTEQTANTHVASKRLDTFLDVNSARPLRARNEKAYRQALDNCYTFIKDGKLVNLNYFNGLSDDVAKNVKLLQVPVDLMKLSPEDREKVLRGEILNKIEPLADVEVQPQVQNLINFRRTIAYNKKQEAERQAVFYGKKAANKNNGR